MKRSALHLICRALLFVFIASTKAAPPLLLPSSGQLSLLNISNSSPALQNPAVNHSLTFGADFPPGPEPPGESLHYDVLFSDPPVMLEFLNWKSKPNRDENVVDACFQKGFLECSDPAKRSTRTGTLTWQIGKTELAIVALSPPDNSLSSMKPGMTYGIATNALIGANKFRLFYPTLNFYFRIYVSLDDEPEPRFVGVGELVVYSNRVLGNVSNQEIGSTDGVDAA